MNPALIQSDHKHWKISTNQTVHGMHACSYFRFKLQGSYQQGKREREREEIEKIAYSIVFICHNDFEN